MSNNDTNDNPTIEIPLPQWAEMLIDRTISKHAERCNIRQQVARLDERVGKLELRFGMLVAFMVGSGALGGVTGVVVSKLLGG